MIHRTALWQEVQNAIAGVDAFSCKTKISQEKGHEGPCFIFPGRHEQGF